MARKKQGYKAQTFETYKPNEHFTRLHDSLIDSPKFKALHTQSQLIYILVKQEYKGDYTGNRVICPTRKIESYGIGRSAISRAFRELEDSGFIEVVERGGFPKKPTVFMLSDKWWKE